MTAQTEPSRTPFRLGATEIEPARSRIRLGQAEQTVEPRVMDVLCALAEAGGAVVGREALIDTVWGVEHGGDERLSRAISILRRLFKELGLDDPVIETIPKRGYRLLLPTVQAGLAKPGAPAEPAAEAPSTHAARRRPPVWMIAAFLAPVLLAAFAVMQVMSPGDAAAPSASAAEARAAVAVLPFEPVSSALEDRYLADGIAEELLSELAALSDLDVAARTSAFQFRGADGDIREIAAQLGVDHVVEGAVRRSGDRVRVSARLVRAEDGFEVWSEVYERALVDLFDVQDEIVRQVSLALQLRLGVGAVGGNSQPRRSVDADALELYYEGLSSWATRMTEDGLYQRAYDSLQDAVALDPEFAEAWAALAMIGATMGGSPLARDRDAFNAQTRQAFEQAVRLDPDNARVHAALVFWHSSTDIDLERARFHLDRAEALAPRSTDTLYARAALDWIVGRPQDAFAAYERAHRLDRLGRTSELGHAIRLAETGRFDAAFAFIEPCFEQQCLAEGFVAYAAAAAAFSGEPDRMALWSERWGEFEAFLETLPESAKPNVVRVLPAFFAIRFDQPDRAERVADVLSLLAEQPVTDTIGMWGPTLATVLPEETTLDLIETAYERGDLLGTVFGFAPYYGWNEYPETILRHPRYHALWAQPGLAEIAEARRENGVEHGLPLPVEAG